ncbi:AAA family ATPase [Winogradskyella thalassocola]|uniref:AAA domain-containing protein n=1 Tax=Winogradskyella thalassocola TaxID=262004 RepID=A0A1G8D5V9_9FLAO|nr:AAA family ATPase [Winogradskyella thalassocola]SDH53116.1 AAA domain-containing protein [Winogradskyella thalassocola]
MKTGFIIKELRLIGKSVENASIVFKKGVNIITGPSNVGKSYIFQCFNYMFGGSKPPKPIKESRNYDFIYLELIDSTNTTYTLLSDLKGGNFKLYNSSIDKIKETDEFEILDRKHSPYNEQTVSAFLLKLNNLTGKKIRTNQKGKTRPISYRDIVKFSMVNESKITTEESLIVSHYTKATEESNVLKLIVTGNDDSTIIESLSKNQIANRKGKLEILKEFINDNTKDLKTFKIEPSLMLNETNSLIKKLTENHSNLQNKFNEIETERVKTLVILHKKQSRKRIIEELYKRTDLLKSHYYSDVSRLKSTIETSVLLNEENHSTNGNCPLCNGEIEEKCSIADINKIIDSCSREIQKIESLIQELLESEKILKEEFKDISIEVSDLENIINKYTLEIDKGVGLEMGLIIEQINRQNEKKSIALGALYKFEQLEKFKAEKEKLENSIPNSKETFEHISTASLTPLSKAIKSVLKGYNYPNLTDVSYSEEQNDFVISGEDRNLSGKGYRAIIYSAFIVALQELLIQKEYSIGVPIIDSPLVTYRKPENVDEITISDDLAMDFYRYITTQSELHQVIVIENEEPPTDVKDKVNHIKFSRKNGFIPTK